MSVESVQCHKDAITPITLVILLFKCCMVFALKKESSLFPHLFSYSSSVCTLAAKMERSNWGKLKIGLGEFFLVLIHWGWWIVTFALFFRKFPIRVRQKFCLRKKLRTSKVNFRVETLWFLKFRLTKEKVICMLALCVWKHSEKLVVFFPHKKSSFSLFFFLCEDFSMWLDY